MRRFAAFLGFVETVHGRKWRQTHLRAAGKPRAGSYADAQICWTVGAADNDEDTPVRHVSGGIYCCPEHGWIDEGPEAA